MSLGFSFGAQSPQAVQMSLVPTRENVETPAQKPQSELFARTAALASQIGGGSAFFREIYVNRYFVSRVAILPSLGRDDDTFDKKRAKNIIRRLKTERSEFCNDQRRQ